MSAIVLDNDLRIPAGVADFESFRRWTLLDEFPERGVFSHLKGELWVESMETRTEGADGVSEFRLEVR